MKTKDSMKYLGAIISNDGRMSSELGARIGMATREFSVLMRLWNHSSLSGSKKIRIFEACVLSKLLYSLHVGVLNTAERRRLDGFQARCLRKILRIAPAYISRTPNTVVLEAARCKPCSDILRARQQAFLEKLRARPDADVCRRMVFHNDGTVRRFSGTRKVGRPRTTWLDQALA